MFFLIAFFIGLLGSFLVIFASEANQKTKFIAFIVLFIIYTLAGWWILWSGLPSIAWPLAGSYSVLLLVWWIVSAIVASALSDDGYGDWHHGWWFPIAGILLIFILLLDNSAMFNSQKYASLIGEIKDKNQKHWSQDVQPLDPTHIRLVPEKLAITLAKTALSQEGQAIGSQFPLAEKLITLQKINNDYWYLIPLDYRGWQVWTSARKKGIPGYVKVSATDPYLKPILVLGHNMLYTPNAYFSENLQRHLYRKYCDKVLREFSFEEDDNGNIYWVISVCHPTIGYWGLIVDGIILCDPETGEENFISKDEVINNPDYQWIDRVVPSQLVESYIDRWGRYKDGWWNSVWTHINLLEAETPTMNYSSEGHCIYVTPVTSDNLSDQTMTGLMYTDARSGEFTYYTVSGGATEEAVIEVVNNATGYKNWHGSEQIVYENVYGKLSALVPILGANGNYQGLAIVENENKRCAIGLTPQEALVEFQKMIMNAGGQISTEHAKDVIEHQGKIKRLGWDISSTGKQYFLYFDGFQHSFIVSNSLQSELPLTKEGDLVIIRYINSEQAAIPTMYFKNLTLDLKCSENEQKVRDKITENQEMIQTKADVDDIRDELKNMSDEDLKRLMENKK